MGKYLQGTFKPRNPLKYKGAVDNIVYRSSWELKMLMYLDSHPDILEYSSEEVVIPYRSPIDGKTHRYFVDFWIKKKLPDGMTEQVLIEIKPKAQTKPPVIKNVKNRTPTRRYINEVATWGVNEAKWNAAINYCNARGWKFLILTEDHLNIK